MTAARGRERPFTPPGAEPALTVGCNPRQRTPRTHDTPWGRPRRQLGWSLRDLAERSGINRGDLSRIESGRGCPTPDQARRLLRVFDDVGSVG